MPFRMKSRRKPSPAGSRELFATPSEKLPEDYLIAHIDGGARGNPGPAGYGVAIEDHHGNKVEELQRFIGIATNNVAEYSGLIAALEYALGHRSKAIRVLSDSELMVRQMKGQYKVKAPGLVELYQKAKSLVRQLNWFEIEHVRREQNRDADRLANAAMDAGQSEPYR